MLMDGIDAGPESSGAESRGIIMTTVTYRTAQDAIKRSISHNEIVTLDYDRQIAADLLAACTDHVTSDGITEYWADAEDSTGSDGKMAWRVHMHAAQTTEAQ